MDLDQIQLNQVCYFRFFDFFLLPDDFHSELILSDGSKFLGLLEKENSHLSRFSNNWVQLFKTNDLVS